jgi:hypothetical protein
MRAKYVKDVQRSGIKRDRKLYLLDTPYEYRDTSDPVRPQYRDTDYLLTSATVPPSGPEVTVLPCDERGTPLSTDPLPGSIKGTRKHEDAIAKMGYELVPDDVPLFPEVSTIPLTLVSPDFSNYGPYADNHATIQFTDDTGENRDRRYTIEGVVHPDGYVLIFASEYPVRPRVTGVLGGLSPQDHPADDTPPIQLPIHVPQTPPDITCNQEVAEMLSTEHVFTIDRGPETYDGANMRALLKQAEEEKQDRIFKDIIKSLPDTPIPKEFE